MSDDLDDGDAVADEDVPKESLLAHVPKSVITLGAGSLATSSMITALSLLVVLYSIARGQYFGYSTTRIYLAAFHFGLMTIIQTVGVYFAVQRVRWTWVMVATVFGALAIITIPFSVLALLCIGLGKYHFTAYTPAKFFNGEQA